MPIPPANLLLIASSAGLEKSHNERFIKPMECLPVEKIPEGDNWSYELKLDGYRLQAVKAGGKVILYSRRGIDLTKRFPYVARVLASLPDDTVIDGTTYLSSAPGPAIHSRIQS